MQILIDGWGADRPGEARAQPARSPSRRAGSGKAGPRFPAISKETGEVATADSRGHSSLLTGFT